jgi:hypothetical protein
MCASMVKVYHPCFNQDGGGNHFLHSIYFDNYNFTFLLVIFFSLVLASSKLGEIIFQCVDLVL